MEEEGGWGVGGGWVGSESVRVTVVVSKGPRSGGGTAPWMAALVLVLVWVCVHSGGGQRERVFMVLVASCRRMQETPGRPTVLSCPTQTQEPPRSNHDSAFCRSSSVGDSVSLITTAFVTSMSGCCCLASWMAMARA